MIGRRHFCHCGSRLIESPGCRGRCQGFFSPEKSRLMEDVLRQNAADTQYQLSSNFFEYDSRLFNSDNQPPYRCLPHRHGRTRT